MRKHTIEVFFFEKSDKYNSHFIVSLFDDRGISLGFCEVDGELQKKQLTPFYVALCAVYGVPFGPNLKIFT